MGTILGKYFPQSLVRTIHSTCAFGTCAMNCMHLWLWKTLSHDCPHGEIRHSQMDIFCRFNFCHNLKNGFGTIALLQISFISIWYPSHAIPKARWHPSSPSSYIPCRLHELCGPLQSCWSRSIKSKSQWRQIIKDHFLFILYKIKVSWYKHQVKIKCV